MPTKFISKFSILKTMPYWSAMHLGNVLAWTPILVTYNGIHVEMENIEWGPGGSAPKTIFTSHALQIAGKYLLSFVIYSRLSRTLTATQKYNVCLKVISGYFKYKMASARVQKTAQRLGLSLTKSSEFSRSSARIRS